MIGLYERRQNGENIVTNLMDGVRERKDAQIPGLGTCRQ